MGDWLDDLDAEQRREWDRFVDHFRRDALEKIDGSAFVASIAPRDGFDVKLVVADIDTEHGREVIGVAVWRMTRSLSQ